ncbi:tyrosine-type recombinase/integrase [Zhongshania sp. BJYM1]|uniref:tyrosine-type recombinase/integrase n=1 Tax=Zhongshania aquatica TaxID=2965069 RepID=UPI0022B3B10D|nr:site-specific integrase [Marortus sp. BJYM1]
MAIIKKTSEADFYGVPVAGFPLILNGDYSVNWLALNWLLDTYAEGAVVSTLGTYAQQLGDFLSQLAVDGIGLQDVHDAWILAYRSELIGRGNTRSYAAQVCRTVLAYLHWLEQERYVYNLIGEGSAFRIRIKMGKSGKMSHPAVKVSSSVKAARPKPRAEWINAIKPFGPQGSHLAARFELMIDWGVSLALRAHEITNLKIEKLPSLETALKALDGGYGLTVTLDVTKGSKPRTVPASPFLIKNTWEYIYTDREEVIRLMRQRHGSKDFKDPGFVFLSSKTGDALCPRAFSNQVKSAWWKAVGEGILTEDEEVWTHGLRHYSANTNLKTLQAAGVSRADVVVRQIMGHSTENALDSYIDIDGGQSRV